MIKTILVFTILTSSVCSSFAQKKEIKLKGFACSSYLKVATDDHERITFTASNLLCIGKTGISYNLKIVYTGVYNLEIKTSQSVFDNTSKLNIVFADSEKLELNNEQGRGESKFKSSLTDKQAELFISEITKIRFENKKESWEANTISGMMGILRSSMECMIKNKEVVLNSKIGF